MSPAWGCTSSGSGRPATPTSARRQENERLAGTGDWCADVERRLADAPLIRKNAVLA